MTQKIGSAQDFAASIRKKAVSIITGAIDALKIDPFFEEDPVAARLVDFAIKRRMNLLLWGPTGCGKSGLVINRMAHLQERCEVFSCTGETSTDELIAKPWIVSDPATGQTITTVAYGAALRAYKEGRGLLLEEVDMAAADVDAAMHRIMELNSTYYVCNVGQQEIVPKHKDFFVIATANTIGTGEDSFRYAGTKPMNEAFKSRFNYCYKMGYLSGQKELQVLMNKTGVPEHIGRMLVSAANDVRDAADPARISGDPGSAKIATTISTRDLLSWATAIVGMDIHAKEAAEYAILNRVSEADKDVIKTAIENRVSY